MMKKWQAGLFLACHCFCKIRQDLPLGVVPSAQGREETLPGGIVVLFQHGFKESRPFIIFSVREEHLAFAGAEQGGVDACFLDH